MNRLLAIALILLCSTAANALPLEWRADWPDCKPVEKYVHRGTDIELHPTWYINGELADTTNWTYQVFVQTNNQATGSWFGPIAGTTFSPTNDVGAAMYQVMLRAQTPGGAVNYTAFARLRMLDSPGFTPGALPLPVSTIDFSKVVALNAPWLLPGATNDIGTIKVELGAISNSVSTLSAAGATNSADIATLKDTTAAINSKIPSAASASNQLADKAWIDDEIDTYAAYYITYTAAGAAFPTRAALLNATVVYSGGAARTPTRNDYAVVLADESHGGAEWRYIYTVAAGATSGQWDAQYPIETNDYDALANKPQINGSTLTGNKTAAQLGVASTADATLNDVSKEWTFVPATFERDGETYQWSNYAPSYEPEEFEYDGATYYPGWYSLRPDGGSGPYNWYGDGPDALTVSTYYDDEVVATRASAYGLRLGPNSASNPNRNKPLATEAEAEALRAAVAAAIASISPTSPAFSNAVLSVGLGIDTNTVAVINELVDSAHDLPVTGATSVGALLLALAAAVAALKKKFGYDTEDSAASATITLSTRTFPVVDATAKTSADTIAVTMPSSAADGKVSDMCLRIDTGASVPALTFDLSSNVFIPANGDDAWGTLEASSHNIFSFTSSGTQTVAVTDAANGNAVTNVTKRVWTVGRVTAAIVAAETVNES